MKLLSRLLVIITFLNFTYYIFASNLFDWEQFYTFIEADRRAWINDFNLPFWSYQLCAGVTRIGDPQSFGLSPIFVFPLIFGTMLGSKIMIILAALVAYIYTRKLFREFISDQNQDNYFYDLLPLFYIFSGGYIAHFHVGHLTYVNFYLFSVINYLVFKIVLRRAISNVDYIVSYLSIFTIFMGGFYHSLAFWGVPLGLSVFVYLFVLIFIKLSEARQAFKICFRLFLIPFLLSAYKLLQVGIYQINFPRDVGTDTVEFNTVPQLLKNLFIPVADFGNYFFSLVHDQKWGIFENTAFSFFGIFIILYLFLVLTKKCQPNKMELQPKLYILILFSIFFTLALGNFSAYSPFNLLNNYLFSHSLRVAVRFNLGICFVGFCFLAYVFSNVRQNNILFNLTIPLVILLNLYIYTPFFTYDLKHYRDFANSELSNASDLKEVVFVPKGNLFTSNNFIYVRRGMAILNCYNPISRNIVAASLLTQPDINQFQSYSIIDLDNSTFSTECLAKVKITQNSIEIPENCQGTLCFNLNGINPKDWSKGFYLNQDNQKYCFNSSRNQLNR